MMACAKSTVMFGRYERTFVLAVFKFSFDASSTSPNAGSVESPPVVSRPMSQNFASPTGTASQENCVLDGTAPLVA